MPPGPDVDVQVVAWAFMAGLGLPEIDARLLTVLAERSDETGEGGCLTLGALGVVLDEPVEEVSESLTRLMESGLASVAFWSATHISSWRLPVSGGEPAVGGGR